MYSPLGKIEASEVQDFSGKEIFEVIQF